MKQGHVSQLAAHHSRVCSAPAPARMDETIKGTSCKGSTGSTPYTYQGQVRQPGTYRTAYGAGAHPMRDPACRCRTGQLHT